MCLEIIIVSGNLVIISPIASYFVPSQAEPCWPIAVHCLGAKAMGVALLRPSSWLQEASTPPPPRQHVHIWAGRVSEQDPSLLLVPLLRCELLDLPPPCLPNRKTMGSSLVGR